MALRRLLLRQVDTGFRSESESVGVLGNSVDAELFCQRVKEHVAGLINRFRKIDRAMPGLNPATEAVAVEDRTAGAVHHHVLGDAFLRTRDRHNDLKNRSRSKLRLNSLVE